ncbi:hypothetical protein S7711_06219 [Stachybotrys chartarum IBT 7711]|uniref:Major facilitator superfamily (MFS) profile domain-containing protein n=1 Tax=Stachybotrys chartarum (strain CBS 109288 / IBT 7711) TaxID=1280523 RepID=A0A084AWB1_STACB|nr:hypothetical protein S7711_06219 [Stachybotrys chartarum IBT 7711]KFA49251.1 hypothetical protein S40293_08335 [Stachybotrys chartarum IBT 40293]
MSRPSDIDAEQRQTVAVVSWDDDPNNAQNWSNAKKALNMSIITFLGFLPPLESSVIVPSVPLLRDDFHETRRPVTSLVVSIFVLGFAFGPILLAPLSELYGRRLILNISNIFTFAFSIASATAPNMASFIVFRFIAGSFGSGPMNIAGGSIADQISVERRGFAMSIFFVGIFVGPVIGHVPVIGGFIANDLGWRAVFWFMTIVRGVTTIASLVFLSESHAPTIQRMQARQLPQPAPGAAVEKTPNTKDVLFRSLTRPVRLLMLSPIVTGLSLYLALIYGYMYLLFTTFSTVFPEQYGFGVDTLGLAFLGLGTGCVLALLVLSWFSDWVQDWLTKKHGESKPEYRLLPMVLGIPFLPIGLFVYGWTTQYKVHWIVPIIFTGFAGAGLTLSFLPTQVYMIDAYTTYAASAMAATSIVRSIFGATLPLAGLPLYSSLGYGWGNSLLGFIAIVVSLLPLLFWRYGEALRKKYNVELD